MIKKCYFSLFSVSVFLFLFLGQASALAALKAPTIIRPADGEKTATFLPIITGVAESNASISVFIDDKIVGLAKTKNSKNGIGSFAFRTKNKLKSGKHAVYAVAKRSGEASSVSNKIIFVVPKIVKRSLDGTATSLGKDNGWPIGVMIDSYPFLAKERWEVWGLSEASVVYNTMVEGNITRFLAVFDSKKIKLSHIGPIRSTRPYFAEWAREYDAVLMHVGGSPAAFEKIGKLRIRSANMLYKAQKYFWRESDKVFTSSGKMEKLAKDYKIAEAKSSFQKWKFKKDAPIAKRGRDKKSVRINFNPKESSLNVEYKYNRQKNIYERFYRKNDYGIIKEMVDAANSYAPVSANNVIIQQVPKDIILDKKGRRLIETTGRGKGFLLQDGKIIKIKWEKKTASSRTIFKDLGGKEIEFNPGPIWIEVLPLGRPWRTITAAQNF